MADKPIDILHSYKQKVIDALIESLEENKRVASAQLIQSIDVRITAFATRFEFVVLMEDYWKYVEYGRPKGKKQPPQDAMLELIKDRGITQYKTPGGKVIFDVALSKGFVKKNKSLKSKMIKKAHKQYGKEQRRKTLAFLLGRGIARRGIKPTNFVEEAFNGGVIDNLTKDLSKALGREIALSLKFKE